MRTSFLLALIVFLGAQSQADAACIDPATLTRSAVGITRMFDAAEATDGVGGVRGTGWFLSPTTIVTVEHVAAEMKLARETWRVIDIDGGAERQSIAARIRHLAGNGAERIAVLELARAFVGAESFRLRLEPLTPDEPVVSLAYPGARLRVAGGRFVQYGDAGRFAGAAFFEMYDGNDRLVLDHGASGAPVLDCAGRVVAVVSNLYVRTIRFMRDELRVSTAWGEANVVSVPVPALGDLPRVE